MEVVAEEEGVVEREIKSAELCSSGMNTEEPGHTHGHDGFTIHDSKVLIGIVVVVVVVDIVILLSPVPFASLLSLSLSLDGVYSIRVTCFSCLLVV